MALGFTRQKTAAAVSGATDTRLENVEKLFVWLIRIGAAGIGVMLLFGLGAMADMTGFAVFFLWGALAAMASMLAGGAFGILFGLPTVRRLEISGHAEPVVNGASITATAQALPPNQSGTANSDALALNYVESTNLEQVADWLTKIIIGLSLTQYESWLNGFRRLSFDVSTRMLSGSSCGAECDGGVFPDGTAIPGGVLLIAYCLLGFLISYFWMRGYFIIEMETARSVAKARASRKIAEERAAAQIAGLKADADRLIEQARLAEAAASKRAEKAEADKLIAEEKQRKAEADAQAARQNAEDQGLLQSRQVVTFTPEDATKLADQVVFATEAAQAAVGEVKEAIAAGTNSDDPWAGQFGSSPEQGGLKLSAEARQSADPLYYDITLFVRTTDPTVQAEMAGKSARVFLHPTFGEEVRTVYFDKDGVAQLQILAYGAFTVGVLVETGVKLELNLATIEGIDPSFLSR